MAAQASKCTILFQQGSYGWSENHFLAEPSSTLEFEMGKLETLAAKRIALCGKQTYISYLKVSNETVQRDVRVKYLGGKDSGALVGRSTVDSDVPTTAILIKRNNTLLSKSAILYLRGVWDDVIIEGGAVRQDSATWTSAYNGWKAEMLTGWGFVGKDTATPARQNVSLVQSDVNGFVLITTAGNVFDVSQVGKNTKIFISGVQGSASINGTQIVRVTGLTTCTTVKRIPIFDYIGGGFVTNYLPKFYSNFDVVSTRVVERKAGRPSYQSRGRSRARTVA